MKLPSIHESQFLTNLDLPSTKREKYDNFPSINFDDDLSPIPIKNSHRRSKSNLLLNAYPTEKKLKSPTPVRPKRDYEALRNSISPVPKAQQAYSSLNDLQPNNQHRRNLSQEPPNKLPSLYFGNRNSPSLKVLPHQVGIASPQKHFYNQNIPDRYLVNVKDRKKVDTEKEKYEDKLIQIIEKQNMLIERVAQQVNMQFYQMFKNEKMKLKTKLKKLNLENYNDKPVHNLYNNQNPFKKIAGGEKRNHGSKIGFDPDM